MIKKVKGRHILGLVILFMLAGLIAVTVRGLRSTDPVQVLEKLPENVDLALKDFSYTESQDGVRRWTVNAASAGYSRKDEMTRIEDLHVVFYDVSGRNEQVILTARQGRIDVQTRQLEVWDDVEVTTAEGETLFTDRLHYSDEGKLITTDAPVRYASEGMTVRGRGMRLDVVERTVHLNADVQAWLRHSLEKAG